jgi:hypothetical protein
MHGFVIYCCGGSESGMGVELGVLSIVFIRLNTPRLWALGVLRYHTWCWWIRDCRTLIVLLFCVRIASYGVGGFGFLKSNIVTIYLLLISHLRGELCSWKRKELNYYNYLIPLLAPT